MFVLATTEIHRVPATIVSRCQRYEFGLIASKQIMGRLQEIAEAEEIDVEEQALAVIAKAAKGSMRDGIGLLDQLSVGGSVTMDDVLAVLGAERRDVIVQLADAMTKGNGKRLIQLIHASMESGSDPRELARQLADMLRGLMLIRIGATEVWDDPMTEDLPMLRKIAMRLQAEQFSRWARTLYEVAANRSQHWLVQLPLETTLVACTEEIEKPPEPVVTFDDQKEEKARPPAPTQQKPEVDKITKDGAEAALAQVLDDVRQEDFKLMALLSKAFVVDVQGETLVLGFEEEFHKRQAETKQQDLNERMRYRTKGAVTRVKCVVGSKYVSETTTNTVTDDEKPFYDEDVLVKLAMEELGAVPSKVET
jgi:DNA polymerase-3 subunit gamma/tau